MKLYSSALCFGLLVVMYCQDRDRAPVVISDYCRNTSYAVAKIVALGQAERKALPTGQKRANLSILKKYRKDCAAKAR